MSLSKSFVERLGGIVGRDGLLTSLSDLTVYSYDGTTNWQSMPEAVVFPTTVEQISGIMKLASDTSTPVTVRGAGTCVSGGPVPVSGGVVLCTARMNRIIEIDKDNFTVTAEAGVVLNDLNQTLARHNLFFPPDPQSFMAATIGGCVSENAGGPYAVKYGVTKHYLLGVKVVLPSGSILSLGGNTMKNVTGYDLPQLICGSEGTLAVLAQVTFRLLSLPEARQTVLATFNTVRAAGLAVSRIRARGIVPAKIELMDNWILRRVEEITPLGLPATAEAMLLFELDGTTESVKKEVEQVIEVCRESGVEVVRSASDAKEAERFWTARRAGFSAIFSNASTVLAEDVVAPVSRIPELIEKIEAIRKRYDMTIVIIGHAGDGNLHPSVLTSRDDPEHYARAQDAIREIFEASIDLGGAISGEHGIGLEKKKFLKKAMPPGAINLLKEIKKVFDPKGILNPGKIWE